MPAPTISVPVTGTNPNKATSIEQLEAQVDAALEANHNNIEAHKTATDNPHGVTKDQVGLANVDNTSDADKPISTAQAAADNLGDIIRLENGGGTGNAVTADRPSAQSHVSLTNGQLVLWYQPETNTGDATLTIGGTEYGLRTRDGFVLAGGELVSASRYIGVIHSSSRIRILSPVRASDIGAATAAQGAKADSAVQPGSLSTVATTGAYSDLTGRPSLGSAAAASTGDFATAAQGAKADSAVQPGELAEEVTTRALEDALVGYARPGEAPSLYRSEITGAAGTGTPYTSESVVNDVDMGASIEIVNAATHVARRAPVAVRPGRVYKGRWELKRITAPVDPLGDAVEYGVRWLDNAKNGVTGGSGNRAVAAVPLPVADGPRYFEATFSKDVSGVDFAIPSSAHYACPWGRTYGVNHATRIALVDFEDITDVWASTGVAAAAGATAGAAAASALVGSGNGLFPDGAEGAPAVSFAGDTDTGIRRAGADTIAITAAGTDRVQVSSSAVSIGLPITGVGSYGFRPFENRAAWIAALGAIPMSETKVSFLAGGIERTVRRVAPSVVIPDANGWEPTGEIAPEFFTSLVPMASKSEADASSDDWSPAVQAAVDHATLVGKRELVFGTGYYRLMSGVTIPTLGFKLRGASANSTNIYICHMGFGLRIKDRNFGLEGIHLLGYPARDPALIEEYEDFSPFCMGLWFETDDLALGSTSQRCRDIELKNYKVSGHHVGAAFVGAVTGHSINGVWTNNAINFDLGKGVLTGRTNKDGTPIFRFVGGEIGKARIHAFTIGYRDFTTSTPSVRIVIENIDAIRDSGTCTIPNLRMAPAQIWARGDQITQAGCVYIGGVDDLGDRVSAMALCGSGHIVQNPRFLDFAGTECPILWYSIDNDVSAALTVQTVGTLTGPECPAMVQVDRHPLGNTAGDGPAISEPLYPLTIFGIKAGEVAVPAITGPTIGAAGFRRVGALIGALNCPPIVLGATVSKTSDTTLADTELQAWIETGREYQFEAVLEYDGPTGADIKLQFSKPSGCTVNFAPIGPYAGVDDVITLPVIGAADLPVGAGGANTWRQLTLRGRCTAPSAAGYLSLQFAQNASVGTATRIRAGSTLRVYRVRP